MPSSPFNLTKKHSDEVDTDSLVLSQQLRGQGGVSHEDVSETGQHMLLAHQLGAYEGKYSVANILNSQNWNYIHSTQLYKHHYKMMLEGSSNLWQDQIPWRENGKGYHLHTGIHVFIQSIVHASRGLIPCVYTALDCSQITLFPTCSFKPNKLVSKASRSRCHYSHFGDNWSSETFPRPQI